MTRLGGIFALIAVAGIATPAPGQYNPYSNQPGYNYPAYPGQPSYGYNQGYTRNPVTDIIDQLLGNRYNVTDRQAVRQCARAATAQAQNQFGGGYNNRYGYNQGFAAPSLRVSAITDVERRSNGLRVRGVLSNGYQGQYGNGDGYRGSGYGNYGDRNGYGNLTFRCSVDYRGVVTDVRVGPNGDRRY